MLERLEVTGVQMPPDALLGTIVPRQVGVAIRTTTNHADGVLRRQINALARRIQGPRN
jgi:hypothetical protein